MSCTEDFTNSVTVKVTVGAAGCGSVLAKGFSWTDTCSILVEGLSATSAEVSSGAGTLVDCTTGGSISIISA